MVHLGRGPIELIDTPASTTLVFSYLHTLSNPDIRDIPMASARKAIEVRGDAILRFGMLDGTAIVHGRRVVYDPQSPGSPEPFPENGSSAESLAYVCNLHEAMKLTGERSALEAGAALLRHPSVVAAVIKQGPRGCHWFDQNGRGWIAATPTDIVFKIGSGDVFSAVFAHCWAELSMSVAESARYASLAAAHYCLNRSLPLPKRLSDLHAIEQPRGGAAIPQPDHSRIYLAAPFFTLGQRWLLEETRSILQDMGAAVFSPLHDVGLGDDARRIAAADIEGLRACTAVLGLVDGLDTGTIFEIGYARAIKLPVVAYADRLDAAHSTMLQGTDCEVVEDYSSAIYRAFWRADQV